MWVSWFTSTRCHWLQVTSLWLLWRKAAPKPGVNCVQGRFWKLHKFGIKVFCSAGRSASWESYGLGRHFLRNFIAQIDTSEENHRGMKRYPASEGFSLSCGSSTQHLLTSHHSGKNISECLRHKIHRLHLRNSSRKSRNESVSKTWRTPAHSLLGFPPARPVVHPFFVILFLHARVGMLQLRLEQIQHGAGRLGPWKNKDVWQFIQQWLQSYNSGSGMTVGHGSWTTSGKPVMESGSSVGTP